MFKTMYKSYDQAFPPRPTFTEKDVPLLDGKVYIVTGANTGVGKCVAQILYSKNAKVYVAARSESKALAAIDDIKKAEPSSKGQLVFLHLDLADLSTIKASAETFLQAESRLHVLFNNAGTVQGYDMQLGVNCLGSFLFTKLLTPCIKATAKAEPAASVRVVWVASSAAEMHFAPPGGVPMDNLDYHVDKDSMTKYSISKAGNVLHNLEYAKLLKADGVASVALNPGNLRSDLWRHQFTPVSLFLNTFILHPTIHGAYTEIFAAFSPEITMENTGTWVAPWGRFAELREDLVAAGKSEAEGGSGIAKQFWDWSEEQVKPFA
ncbi:hypothetical protein B0I35DRAFT_443341 [Stachybotrys elegans]|uniref:NAD(P)-binding protein n=1 Tax=Stachybotrys elegans TaxID=80388 RepID=A0A8K0WKG3_9HYPO|nr:hypothetical protein B0I35DRAFT_443341 [Stachybotrys elegans]